MRKSIILDDGVNDKVMNITSRMIRDTKQSWSVSNVINSLLCLALEENVTVDQIIKVQDKLGRKEPKQ